MDVRKEKTLIDKQVKIIIDKILEDTKRFKISTFHLSELPESNNWQNHPNIDPYFKKYIEILNNYKGDCLYWFDCDTKEDAKIFNEALASYRNKKGTKGYRSVPTSNKYSDKDKTIYVGVRRGNTAKKTKISKYFRTH